MRRALIAIGFAAALAACSESDADTNVVPDAAAVPDPHHRVVAAREELSDHFADVYRRYVGTLVSDQPVRNVLLDPIEPVEIERRLFLAHLYGERDFQPVLTTDGRLDARGEALLAALQGVETHGLDPADYVHSELLAALDVQRQVLHARSAAPAVTATRAERRAVAALVVDSPSPPDDAAVDALAQALDGAEPGPVPELRAAHRQAVALERVARGNGALVDVMLVDAILAYAFDQRNFNTAWVDEEMDEDARHEFIAERTRETFRQLAATTTAAEARAFFDSLAPPHAQYPLLVAERSRYAAIVEAGGWETVEPRHVERGSRGSTVAALQRRLAAEGYLEAPADGAFGDVFDERVEAAVRAYQETHQMEATGESDTGFWNSINIPAEDRLAQIDLTLQRWRESRIGDDPYYVFVNVPDFHAEVWRDGNRDMRFRIVTGNTQQVCDPRTGRTTYANATPLQSAEMTYVVLNPMWNVPARIVEEELLPELLADPTYFETMGFERYMTPAGIEIIRQLPGPENPLGRVKFMFPNPHNTYMHDTSRPQYFRYPVRAFSHGCMRVQEPLELLEYVLTNDGQWDDRRIERIFESAVETTISLRQAIPVHIEYYVVRVDDEGRANFLADIYRYDRDRLSPRSPESLRCTVDNAAPRLVLGEGDVVMYDDGSGNHYTAEQWEYVQAGGTLQRRPDGTFAAPPAGALGRDQDAPAAPSDITEGDLGP